MNRGWTYTNTTETAIVGRVFLPVQAFTILTIILKEVKLMNLTYLVFTPCQKIRSRAS